MPCDPPVARAFAFGLEAENTEDEGLLRYPALGEGVGEHDLAFRDHLKNDAFFGVDLPFRTAHLDAASPAGAQVELTDFGRPRFWTPPVLQPFREGAPHLRRRSRHVKRAGKFILVGDVGTSLSHATAASSAATSSFPIRSADRRVGAGGVY